MFWTNSELRPATAISICEIVNRPDKFVSRDPHLVVDKAEWIQCRYLLVKVQPRDTALKQPLPRPTERKTCGWIAQDPTRHLQLGSQQILIPKPASPVFLLADEEDGGDHTDSDASDVGDEIDAILGLSINDDSLDNEFSSSSALSSGSKRRRESVDSELDMPRKLDSVMQAEKAAAVHELVTPFAPGQSNLKDLPKLPEPGWASSSQIALRRLTQDIKAMEKIQTTTPPGELGWYMDFGDVSNVFQWIVELHSFPERLPLAQDMKALGCQSVVLEIRFGSMYPISPPFVRVVSPMFRPFVEGGGGHITAGGAVCSELLTSSGWLPTLSVDKILLQVRLGLYDEERPARLDTGISARGRSYGILQALEAYKRAVRTHGWKMPDDFGSIDLLKPK